MKNFFRKLIVFRQLETERLLLTRWKMSMAPDLFSYAQDPEVGPMAGWAPHKSQADSIAAIRDYYGPSRAFAIVLKDTGKVIGNIGFQSDRRRTELNSKEIGYSLSREYWNRGYMTEALQEVIKYGFEEMALDIIAICTTEDNARSRRVIEKNGFVYEGMSRCIGIDHTGAYRNELCFSLLKDEWQEMNEK